MPGFLAQLGMQAAGQATGAGMGLLLQRGQDRRQLNMQRKLQRMEMEGTKEMTDYNFKKQLEMWDATNYAAQIAQMKKANLSPGLIYGMSGAGGATTNVETGSVSGGQAPKGGGEALAMGIQMGQAALTAAQIEQIKAQTENIKADTANKPLMGKQIEATTADLLQGIENKKAQQELTEVQTGIATIEEHIKGQTQNAAIAMIRSELRSATATMHMLERNNDIDAKTADEKIAIIEQQLVGAALNNDAIRKGLNKTDQEIEQMKTAMGVMLRQIANAENQTAIDKARAEFETSFGGQAAGIINAIIGGAGLIRGNRSTITHKGGAKNETIHRRE